VTVIRTVRGDVAPDALGMTYPHEHLLTMPPESVGDIDFRMDSDVCAIRELGFFREAGGQTIVEMTTRDYGRDAVGLRHLSETTDVHVICVTGWQKDAYCRTWVEGRSVDDLADEMIREIQQGIDDTELRAGAIKASSSRGQITPAEELVFRAAARAQQATGALITTHTEAGTYALEQVELLRSLGCNPARILIGHLDRLMDYDYHLAIVRTGASIGYDQIGKEKYYPDSLRIEFLLRLAADGYADRVILSGDMARRSSWPSYGSWGGPGLTHILWKFVPWLRERGMPAETIDQILVRNPARLLSMN
jgi:5-phospho-D-xylono-1,4-lactonase